MMKKSIKNNIWNNFKKLKNIKKRVNILHLKYLRMNIMHNKLMTNNFNHILRNFRVIISLNEIITIQTGKV